ncbi:hypothetical protein OEZ85_012411 [Tetradesmus obliquus]|uniref:Uncharacterized protein n=1 Tax=Tetradesmus obliquus TaxID=3088 RepID=A0ABY8TVL8_TETOB|nr:hypothetical protein OEZ85_012411 [Tetradesmus obliquus]
MMRLAHFWGATWQLMPREPQPDCSKQVECGMSCPASPSQEHDDGGLVSDDLPDLPAYAQGAAAAKLNLGFTARFRGSAGAAAASSCVPVGNTSKASGSAEYAAAYTAGPAAQLAAFGGAAYAMRQPEEGAEEQQQEEQEEELQVQQARMSKRPRRRTQQQQQQQQDQDQAEHEQLEQQEAAELQLSPAQISQKREKWQKKLNKLSAAEKQQLSKLNLPKATIQPSKGEKQMLAALGVADKPAASQYFYVIRGPQQTLRCSIMRRITKLLPETYPIYKEVNEGCGLTKKGLQQKKDDCLLFFNKVLAEHLAAEFTPTQAECAPLRELDYVARLLSMVAGRTITAAQVNDVFIPGEKNYTAPKRPGGVSSSSTPLKKRR